MKFRKKPVVIDAIQLTYANKEVIGNEFGMDGQGVDWISADRVAYAQVRTLVRGVKGERYLCKPDIFAATYEPAQMQTFTPSRDYTHYDDVATPLLFEAGTDYVVAETLPGSGGDILVVQHPASDDDVLLRPDKVAKAMAE